MPNRIIRAGINSSDRVNQLDNAEEVFYRRLLNAVDDHGLFDARPSILRAHLYPLRIDRVREADISRWLAACEKAGLILLYEADSKPYLQVQNTQWKSRSEPKFPLPVGKRGHLHAPANNCAQLHAIENSCEQLRPYSETETDSETKSKTETKSEPPFVSESSEQIDDPELEQIAQAVQKVTGLRSASWQIADQIKTAAIELKGQGFTADEIVSIAELMNKTYRVKFIATDMVKDRADLASGRIERTTPRKGTPNGNGSKNGNADIERFRAQIEL